MNQTIHKTILECLEQAVTEEGEDHKLTERLSQWLNQLACGELSVTEAPDETRRMLEALHKTISEPHTS
jgi:hypothetical protein